MVEEDNNIILQEAAVMDVAFLVVGDPFRWDVCCDPAFPPILKHIFAQCHHPL